MTKSHKKWQTSKKKWQTSEKKNDKIVWKGHNFVKKKETKSEQKNWTKVTN